MNNQQWHYSKSSYYILLNKTAFIDVTRAESTHCDTSESTRRRRRRKTSRRRRRRSWAHCCGTHDVRLLHYVEPHSADWTAKHVVTDATTVSKNVFCNGSVRRRKKKQNNKSYLSYVLLNHPSSPFLPSGVQKLKIWNFLKHKKSEIINDPISWNKSILCIPS